MELTRAGDSLYRALNPANQRCQRRRFGIEEGTIVTARCRFDSDRPLHQTSLFHKILSRLSAEIFMESSA
jgi:hypothetical protein